MLRLSVAALAAAVVAVAPARAQDLASICKTVTHPSVGGWGEYRYTGGEQAGSTMRMAIVGTEMRGDTSMIWLEMALRIPMPGGDSAHATMPVIAKMLVPGFGSEMSHPRAEVMKYGTAPAMTMPADMDSGSAGGSPELLQNCLHSQIVGWEQVTVPAGTFRALHVRTAAGDEDTWLDPSLPIGVVKDSSSGNGDSTGVVLVRHGTGATSQITETPRPYDPQILMQMMMQGRKSP